MADRRRLAIEAKEKAALAGGPWRLLVARKNEAVVGASR
jgi:hypothetical protein